MGIGGIGLDTVISVVLLSGNPLQDYLLSQSLWTKLGGFWKHKMMSAHEHILIWITRVVESQETNL